MCQDFAHLAITCLRGLGLPARYVSGYLLTYPPPGMEKLQGADASHAWISVWAPEVGWVDFDPTNGVIPSDEHVTVAYGRDYDDVSPVSGVLLGGSRQTMSVRWTWRLPAQLRPMDLGGAGRRRQPSTPGRGALQRTHQYPS